MTAVTTEDAVTWIGRCPCGSQEATWRSRRLDVPGSDHQSVAYDIDCSCDEPRKAA